MPVSSLLRKPHWIRARAPTDARVVQIKSLLREQHLHTVCEEASCPNLGECFANGTATFMIMGNLCTRNCPFCDVKHGRPAPLDADEPDKLARTIKMMDLGYVVITSVDRDDLADGGASHFAACLRAVRREVHNITIEILTPDFRRCTEAAFDALQSSPPDIFNHNLETVPRLYRRVRPGAVYAGSLDLLQRFKERFAGVPTKSGLMLGLGETLEEVRQVLQDLRANDCDMLTLGQYLQPGQGHLPVERYVHPDEFIMLAEYARSIGFRNVASGPMVRSSYHADVQTRGMREEKC